MIKMNDISNSAPKIKLLIGITLSEIGGSQKVVYDIISNLPEDKYEITLITSPGGELIEWINQLNAARSSTINLITLKSLKHELSPLNDIIALSQLYRIMRKGNYDVAHFHTAKIGFIGRLSAWLRNIPQILYTVHGWGISSHLRPIMRRLLKIAEKVAVKFSTAIICVCKYDMNMAINKKWIPIKKAKLIYNGISYPDVHQTGRLRKHIAISDTACIVGTTMRLKPPKTPLFAIQVMNEVCNKIPNVKFVIIGDGVLKEKCQSLINSTGASDKMFLLGSIQDARTLVSDFDVFVLFSVSEGLPLSIIEAMFAGKPIVSNNVGGISELVEHGVNGYLIDNLDVNAASEYIIKLLKDKALREQMGSVGRQKAIETFNLQTMLSKYQEIYGAKLCECGYNKKIRKGIIWH